MYKVSVIVPIYGVENYIETCVRTLFEQTLDSVEYIFVNDCTKDRSIEILQKILEEYPHRKNSVKILHHEVNKGLPQARQTGIAVATGEYIAHCDSDDWVALDAYEKAYNAAISKNCDILFYNFYCAYNNHSILYNKDIPADDKTKVLKRMLADYQYQGASQIWAALVKRGVYDNTIIYPVNNQGEDKTLMFQLIYFASSYGIIHDALYYYRINEQSMTRVSGLDKEQKRSRDIKANYDLLFSFINSNNLSNMLNSEIKSRKYMIEDMFKRSMIKNEILYPENDGFCFLFHRYTLKYHIINLLIQFKRLIKK